MTPIIIIQRFINVGGGYVRKGGWRLTSIPNNPETPGRGGGGVKLIKEFSVPRPRMLGKS